ncbi:MAG: TadE/TadG family type IV pilus assembly protein [Verrucomicrobiota bacterium]
MPTLQHIRQRLTRFLRHGESGQAFIELAFVVMMLAVLLFGLIDFGRFLYERQIVVNLSREGANLVLRNTAVTNAATAVMNSASPLKMATQGRLIMSTVTNSNGVRRVTSQYATGGLASGSASKLGVLNAVATMPATTTVIPAAGKVLYVTEVYYKFTPITPVGKLLQLAAPSNLYDVAYF